MLFPLIGLFPDLPIPRALPIPQQKCPSCREKLDEHWLEKEQKQPHLSDIQSLVRKGLIKVLRRRASQSNLPNQSCLLISSTPSLPDPSLFSGLTCAQQIPLILAEEWAGA